MDSLALLCNLYGDGPGTVRRLREAGLGSLESIDRAEPARLAALLRTSVRAAQRFQTEGRLLLERTSAPAERSVATAEAEESPTDPLLRKVLEAWRRKDAEDDPAAESAALPPELAEPPERSAPARPVAVPIEPRAPLERAEPAPPALVVGCPEGLDALALEQLRAAGVVTLDGLCGCNALDVSRLSGIRYTRVVHLQFLARRAKATLPAAPPAARERTVVLPAAAAPATLPSTAPAPAREEPPAPERRFSPAEGPREPRPEPLSPLVAPRVDRRSGADVPAPGAEDTLESAGPFA